MPRAKKPEYKSLADALVAVFADEANSAPLKAGDAIEQAILLHPPKSGKTPKATAGTAILNLTRKGRLVKVSPAMYTTPERAPRRKRQ